MSSTGRHEDPCDAPSFTAQGCAPNLSSARSYASAAASSRRMCSSLPHWRWCHACRHAVASRNEGTQLEVFAYVNTSVWREFLAVREDIFLRMIDIVTESGTSFALPSQIQYLAQDPGVDAARTHAAEEAVEQWRSQDKLPFPEFAQEYSWELQNTLDYPPPGSPDATEQIPPERDSAPRR